MYYILYACWIFILNQRNHAAHWHGNQRRAVRERERERAMPPVRRSTRKSAGKSPAKYVPEEEAPVGLPVEEEESEDDEVCSLSPTLLPSFPPGVSRCVRRCSVQEYEAEEDAPSMHFGLASRAALEAEEGGVAPPAVNIFLINALIEGLAGVTALYESFQPEGERMLVADTSSPMVRLPTRSWLRGSTRSPRAPPCV